MNLSKRKKSFMLYSNDDMISQILEKFKNEDSKIYLKLLDILQLLGNFSTKAEVELYETKESEEKQYTKLWCSDLDGNILIFCPISTLKSDKSIIEKLTNERHQMYDLSLLKKFNLTSDNVELTQTAKVSNFKFGRLITDNKSFYNLFLSDNVCYQIQINSSSNDGNIDSKELLIELNKLENIPKFMKYIEIFDSLLQKSNINYSLINLRAYKNFEKICSLLINGDEPKVEKVPTLKKSKI